VSYRSTQYAHIPRSAAGETTMRHLPGIPRSPFHWALPSD
jgi:hypothetical protein